MATSGDPKPDRIMPARPSNTKPARQRDAELRHCSTPFGDFILQRHTPDPTGTLRAWDAADLYLLDTLVKKQLPARDSDVLIVNDQFGALSTVLSSACGDSLALHTVSDSFVARRAITRNLSDNNCAASIQLTPGFTSSHPVADLVLMKVPKSLALLSDQLHQLRQYMHAGTTLLAAGMARHLVPNVRHAFEDLIGPTTSSRAVRKARVLATQKTAAADQRANPWPGQITVPGFDLPLIQHSAVFSRKRLDAGSELLLAHFPSIAPGSTVIDLGCGNGVLGLMAMKTQPDCKVIFIDESSAAVRSARANTARLFPDADSVYLEQDCLDPPPPDPVQLILCNPPFHAQHNLVLVTAERMFRESRQALAPGGSLVIVGNRHLGYADRLQRLFGNHRLIAENSKFQIISARRR